MKVKVSARTINTLRTLTDNVLLDDKTNIRIIRKVKYEKVTETPIQKAKRGYFIRKREIELPVEIYYITEFVMEAYHANGDFVGTYFEDYCVTFLKCLNNKEHPSNLYNWRKNWLDLKQQITAFGMEITMNPKKIRFQKRTFQKCQNT
jgi:hypothetical protein